MSLASIFFRKSVGALLVYDVACMKSFQDCEKWYQQILQHANSRVVIMLIGNKKDKDTREVPYNTALEYALTNNFGYMEVSARHGLGIKEATNLLVSQIYKSILAEQKETPRDSDKNGRALPSRDDMGSFHVRT